MNSNLIWQKRIRNYAGLLGGLLPWISLFSAWLYGKISGGLSEGFWSNLSISETYYVTPALTGILTSASIVLMCYDGYEKIDNIITTLSGVFGIMIVLFPCKCGIASSNVGFFQLPVDISNIVHCTSAIIFFCLLAVNSLFLFTKTNGNRSAKKRVRDVIYRACGIGMLCAMSLMVIPFDFPAKTWLVETVALTFFSVSWLVKGGVFKFLED